MDYEDLAAKMAEDLLAIERMRMPFGKYGPEHHPPAGVPIFDLPAEYLAWFAKKGFPKGRLGELMAHVCEIKELGMDSKPIIEEMMSGDYENLLEVFDKNFGDYVDLLR
jgi:uncharacterized protein (DUF3820 family)